MACESPNILVKRPFKKANGKLDLKFIPKPHDNIYYLSERYGAENLIFAPCGKCPSCKKAYRRMWSLRCEAEARLYKDNCFVTLTMDNDNVTQEVQKSHIQKFLKDLRNRGVRVRYFACGEYGRHPLTGDRERPHYHAILFGYLPSDLKPHSKSKSGQWMFTSEFLSSIWQKGFVTVQLFDPACAGYVAGYVDKKEDEEDGFLMMSTRPGLGYDYYRKNMEALAEFDSFISKGGFVSRLPRYFETAADHAFFDISDLKQKRVEMTQKLSLATCQEHGFINMEEVFRYQGDKERRKKKYARNL